MDTEITLVEAALSAVAESARRAVGATLAAYTEDGAWGRLLPVEAAQVADPTGARLPLLALTTELDGIGRPFAEILGRSGARSAAELLGMCEAWQSGVVFEGDDADRAVEAGSRLLRALGDHEGAARVASLGLEEASPDAAADESVPQVVTTGGASDVVPAADSDSDADATLPTSTDVRLGDFAIPQDSNPFYSSESFVERMTRGTADLFGARSDDPEPAADPEPAVVVEAEPAAAPEPPAAAARVSEPEPPGAMAAFFAAASSPGSTPASTAYAASERLREAREAATEAERVAAERAAAADPDSADRPA
ncbi:hypothetical protein HQQ80_11415 [Microbacteriaceae bacterium VKM Ac-2855]|nr:hypothetical protein [Microbacteriaceae bacterium VKM Ac-2855]